MSNLKAINEEFEKQVQEQVKARLEMRDGQVIVVRKFPAPSEMREPFWQRNEMMRKEFNKQLAQVRSSR